MSKDKYIIVGGGVGGMFAGAVLAHYGKKVTLIESHYALGGFASSFKRKKSEHEIAIHAVGKLRDSSFEKHWHQKLGIVENVQYADINEFYDFYAGSKYFKIPSTIEGGRSYFLTEFPHEEIGINKYFDMLFNLKFELDGFLSPKNDPFRHISTPYSMYLGTKTCSEYLNEIFTDPLLIQIIQGNHQLYHHDPNELCALNFMFGNAYYMSEGLRFIKGTSHNLIKYLRLLIEKAGGEILLGHVVDGIQFNDENISAISMIKRSNNKRIIKDGGHFIFNNSPLVVKQWLAQKKETLLCSDNLSYSSCNIYLEFDQAPKKFGVKGYMNTFVLSGTQTAKIQEINQFAFIDYSQIDSALGEDKYLASIIYLDSYENWNHLSKNEYDQQKNEKLKILFEILESYFPGLTRACSRIDFATPLTIERYTKNPKGASYGFSCGLRDLEMNRDLLSFEEKYNMSFASAWVFGAGFSLTSCSGLKAALDILGVEYFAE